MKAPSSGAQQRGERTSNLYVYMRGCFARARSEINDVLCPTSPEQTAIVGGFFGEVVHKHSPGRRRLSSSLMDRVKSKLPQKHEDKISLFTQTLVESPLE